MNSSAMFPLITLQPVTDSNNAWVALLLEADALLGGEALALLLRDCALAGALEAIPCIAAVDPLQIDPGLCSTLPARRLILRFPVAIAAEPANAEALAALHAAGCGLMVEGFPPAEAKLSSAVASLAVTCPGHAMPAGFADRLRQLPGPHLALGTTENVCPGFCKFHWLAGHLAGHAAPTPKSDPATRSLLLKLLARVTADADSAEIESVIKRDPNLSYHLLKLVNSVAFATTQKITSFNQAISLLGRRQLQRWLQLLLYARPQGSTAASPLLPRAALRASLMEALVKQGHQSREIKDHAFMVGMFSLLDVLFGLPLAEVIAPLNLPDDVVHALTARRDEGADGGQLGILLDAVVAGEAWPDNRLAEALAAAGIGRAAWGAALVEAVCWTVQVSKEA